MSLALDGELCSINLRVVTQLIYRKHNQLKMLNRMLHLITVKLRELL